MLLEHIVESLYLLTQNQHFAFVLSRPVRMHVETVTGLPPELLNIGIEVAYFDFCLSLVASEHVVA